MRVFESVHLCVCAYVCLSACMYICVSMCRFAGKFVAGVLDYKAMVDE